MKISFCTTCMNRLHQLKQTLPENIERTSHLSNVEFSLINYNSKDGMNEWVKENFQKEIGSGILRYGHTTEPTHFHMSKAKNLAHKLATGDILMNLDADNFIGNSAMLIEKIFSVKTKIYLYFWQNRWDDGTCGRIVVTKKWFYNLGGYDEEFLGIAYDDLDFINRAERMGLKRVHIPDGSSIVNERWESVQHVDLPSKDYLTINRINQTQSEKNIENGQLKANPNGWGKGKLIVNFKEEVIWI